jgi:nitrogen fixation NifU-like protein
MEDLYREQILEHSRYPHNQGELEHPTISCEEHNPLCGDRVRIDLLIEHNHIADVRFNGRGCAISQASASLLTDAVKGMSVEEARALGREAMLELIGLPLDRNPVRIKCAMLPLKTLKMCLYSADTPEEDLD